MLLDKATAPPSVTTEMLNNYFVQLFQNQNPFKYCAKFEEHLKKKKTEK